jgi:tetratricopeptide (TPR) repeat protein
VATWFLILAAGTGWGQTAQPKLDNTPSQLAPVFAAWEKGHYAAAIMEFEKVIKRDPNNVILHAAFVTQAVTSAKRTTRLAKEEAEKAKAEAKQKHVLPSEHTQKEETHASPVAVTLPSLKSPDELAKMGKEANDIQAAVVQLQQLYEQWAKENPTKAFYPFELASFGGDKDFVKREQYLLQAVALDPKFIDAYSELAKLNSGFDDHAAAGYAKKASETKPEDSRL